MDIDATRKSSAGRSVGELVKLASALTLGVSGSFD
jgi:hypothetical protein